MNFLLCIPHSDADCMLIVDNYNQIIIMTSTDIYNQITALLNTFPNNRSFKLGISEDARITWKYGQTNVWHPENATEAKSILKRLHADFGLSFNENSSGEYIYVDTFSLNNYHD
jgi:lipopolysaccharide biosynthesis protein